MLRESTAAALAVAAASGLAFALISRWDLQVAAPLYCVAPAAQYLAVALGAGGLVAGLWPAAIDRNFRLLLIIVVACLSVAALWWGSYAQPGLALLGRQPAVLQGFMVSRPGRPPLELTAGGIALVGVGSITQVQAVALPRDRPACVWQSAYGGRVDDPTSCSVAYQPSPASDYDVLNVLMRSSCGLPPAVGRIRVSVLP